MSGLVSGMEPLGAAVWLRFTPFVCGPVPLNWRRIWIPPPLFPAASTNLTVVSGTPAVRCRSPCASARAPCCRQLLTLQPLLSCLASPWPLPSSHAHTFPARLLRLHLLLYRRQRPRRSPYAPAPTHNCRARARRTKIWGEQPSRHSVRVAARAPDLLQCAGKPYRIRWRSALPVVTLVAG